MDSLGCFGMRNSGKFTLQSLRDHHNHRAAPICPYAHIWPYGHMGIWAYGHMGICKKIWPNGVSPKRESKMQLRDVNQRSLGHSNQKLWPKVDLGEFHHVYPLEHLKSFATDRLWVYNAENFFVAFSRYIYSAVSTIKQNFKKCLFWDTLTFPSPVFRSMVFAILV